MQACSCFTNIVCWVDPERRVAAALLTSGKPVVYPELYHLWDALRQIGRACPKERTAGTLAPTLRPAAARPAR